MKSTTKQRLLQDNIKYSAQIGISLNHIPTVVFTAKEIDELYEARRQPREHRPSRGCYGRCLRSIHAIFINGNITHIRIKRPIRNKGWYKIITKKNNYYQARHTLVHELVHYRWPKIRHGNAFEKRIKEIIQGRPFPTAD
jgi:hypothetical protein